MTEVTFTKHYSSVQRLTTLPIKGKPQAFSPADKAVYFYLLAYQESTGKVFPSIPTLATELGMSQSTIKRSLKFLRETTLIKSERRYDDSNLYSVTFVADVLRMAATEAKPEKVFTLTAFSLKAIDTALRLIGQLGTNFKAGEAWLAKWLQTPSQTSQNASGEDFSLSPVKSYSGAAKALKTPPVEHADDEPYYLPGEREKKAKRSVDSEIGREEFVDTFEYDDIKEKIKDNPEGW
ncbi:hypothetical protein DH20_06790 [Pantoea agglomerans]|nr:hypothetical protein [Pantoea agglomerans]